MCVSECVCVCVCVCVCKTKSSKYTNLRLKDEGINHVTSQTHSIND